MYWQIPTPCVLSSFFFSLRTGLYPHLPPTLFHRISRDYFTLLHMAVMTCRDVPPLFHFRFRACTDLGHALLSFIPFLDAHLFGIK